jgi:hypothetical protein
VKGILGDNDVEGYVQALHAIWLTDAWRDIWVGLGLSVERFATVGLAVDSSDAIVWRTCQREKLVLITGNRNASDPESLELVIRTESQPSSLPVGTLADPQRIARDRVYAVRVAERLLERLFSIDDFRGAGRIYVP